MRIIQACLLALSFLLTACSTKSPTPSLVADRMVSLSPHAEEQCLQGGGTPGETLNLAGVVVAVCQLSNGKRCEEPALLGGGCLR